MLIKIKCDKVDGKLQTLSFHIYVIGNRETVFLLLKRAVP